MLKVKISKFLTLAYAFLSCLILSGCSDEETPDPTEKKYLNIWRELVIEMGII